MSENHPTYIDNIPVKILEKYKPQKIADLPKDLYNDSSYESIASIDDYNFSLEKEIITSVNHLIRFREIARQNRAQRIRNAELELAKKNEELQKRLLTAVSYPNEDLSSSDEGDDNSGIIKNQNITNRIHFPQQSFNTILMPTIVSKKSDHNNYNNIDKKISKINYSDFENDTSSPFDNIELKTINDLDVLAQVLKSSPIHYGYQIEDHKKNLQNFKNPEYLLCNDGNKLSSGNYFEARSNEISKINQFENKNFETCSHSKNIYKIPREVIKIPESSCEILSSSSKYQTVIPNKNDDFINNPNKCRSLPDIVKELKIEANALKTNEINSHNQLTNKTS